MANRTTLDDVLVQGALVFSRPSFESFAVLRVGWTFAGMQAMALTALRALGWSAPQHCSTYYRFLSRAVWQPDALRTCLVRLLLPLAPENPSSDLLA